MKPALFMAALLIVVACGSTTAACDAATPMLGKWQYSGVRDAPGAATLDGTLEITSESCTGFQGRIDLQEVAPSGQGVRLAGPVTGRLTSESSLRFDAWIAEVARQHVASLDGAGADGNWFSTRAAETATGTFRVRRQGLP